VSDADEARPRGRVAPVRGVQYTVIYIVSECAKPGVPPAEVLALARLYGLSLFI
jgi:hypothetical protein